MVLLTVHDATDALQRAGLLGQGRVVAVERMTEGKASAVYKLQLSTGRAIVFKSAARRVVETEVLWLRGWREIGIDTPEVYGHGVLSDDTPFLLMEFVDGPSVWGAVEAGQLPLEATIRETGRMLATMHTVQGVGFGSSHFDNLDAAGNGRFQTLREHLAAEALPLGLAFAVEVGDISADDLPAVERAVELLDAHAQALGPRRTHGDFRVGNMIHHRDSSGRDRLVVIDPTPALTHPYVCLAYSLLLPQLHTGEPQVDILGGYGEVSPVDPDAFDAALLIRAGIMFNSFGRRRDTLYARRLPGVFARLRQPFI